MNVVDLSFDQPVLTQKQALEVCQVDSIELDSFIRQGVVAADREGRNRMFSMRALIIIDLAHLLIDQFRMRPPGAGEVAATAADEYAASFEEDRRDIASGSAWPQVRNDRGDYTATTGPGFFRDLDGFLRRFRDGDDPVRSVGIVLPSRLVARRIVANVAALPA